MVEFKPRDYQRLAIDWLATHPKAALWASPGAGKTVSTLSAFNLATAWDGACRALVLAPPRVVDTGVWSNEVQKWTHLQNLKATPIVGTPDQRLDLIAQRHPIQVLSLNLIPWLLDLYINDWEWDTLIIDEASKIKDHAAVWFNGKPRRQGMEGRTIPAKPGLRHAAGRCERVWELTGTPGGLLALWPQVFLLDGGERLGKNITAYRQRWFRQDYDGYSWAPLPHAEKEILPRLEDLCLTIKAEDYLDLPPVVTHVVPVHLPAGAMKTYRTLEKEFFLRIEDDIVEAANAAVLSGKLLQASSGFLYHEDGSTTEIHDAKLSALTDIVEETNGPVIVAYHFKADLERIQARLPHAVAFDGSQSTVERFGRGEIPILLLHPQSAGHGIDGLQHGGHHLIWFGLTWSLEAHDQTIERIGPARQYSAGRDAPVFVHYLAAQGTVDEMVLERLLEKKEVQDIILNHMKEKA